MKNILKNIEKLIVHCVYNLCKVGIELIQNFGFTRKFHDIVWTKWWSDRGDERYEEAIDSRKHL